MTAALFLVDDIGDGAEISLTGDEGRHAARVRRIAVGERVRISDGRGSVADCEVSAVLSDGVTLQVLARSVLATPSPRLVVVQALPKGDRAELAVETMTELGVDEIVPWAASRSVVQWQGDRGEKARVKWQRTAREASKQSRRAWVPVVSELASTAGVARRMASSFGLVLHEEASTPVGSVELPTAGEIVVVVGPEGGISHDELAVFESAGVEAVRLGESVLRTSTAGAAALAVLSLRLGRWG